MAEGTNTSSKKSDCFKSPSVRPPSIQELVAIAHERGFTIQEDDMKQYRDHITNVLEGYNILDAMIPPTLPVKYPRTPGYRPEPEDNTSNAWYWKCDIQGSSDGLLKGKSVGIKDNICVAGVPMMNGTRIMEYFVPDVDATVVTKILDEGGRIVGKTNCEPMCFGGNSFTNDTGSTLNPFDPDRASGGSSGGSAAAVKNGEIDMALGADQGGSIRIPAAWCGIVGFKPTFGLVSYTGVVPIEITLDTVGPMAGNVSDCALMLEAITGYDSGRDPRQRCDIERCRFSDLLDIDVKGKKVGLLVEGFEFCDENVQNVVKEAASTLQESGVIVEHVSMPLHKQALEIWAPISMSGSFQCMIQGYGAGHHYKGYYSESIMKKLREGYTANAGNWSEPLMCACLQAYFDTKNYGNRYYGRAQNMNMKLTQAYDKLLETYDVIVMPTAPCTAPLLPMKDSSVAERLTSALDMFRNTSPFNATGHPALTINAGMLNGLPVGMQIVGKHFDDLTVLQIARAFEELQ